MLAPGASVVAAQATAPPSSGSFTVTLVNATLPVFCTVKLYAIVEPTVWPLGVPAVLVSASAGACVIGVVSSPVQPVLQVLLPVAVAVFTTWPASMSSWVRV